MTQTGRSPKSRDGKGKFVRTVDNAQRDADAARLRTQGATYQKIADTLGYSDPTAARRAVEKILLATVAEPAEQLRALEVERLDALLARAWAVLDREHVAVSSGEIVVDTRDPAGGPLLDDGPTLAAIDRILKIAERRARLLGLDAPTKVEQGGQVRYVIEGVDLEALR